MSQVAAGTGFFAHSVSRPEECNEKLGLKLDRSPASWSLERFGQEQLQGLVRKLFLTPHEKPVRQVLFTAADRETNISLLSQLVGEALAFEKAGSVAVMGRYRQLCQENGVRAGVPRDCGNGATTLRENGFRLNENLWLVPNAKEEQCSTSPKLSARICGLRREFDYSIVEGPTANSHEAMVMAQMVDGVALVLSARYTRKSSARNVQRCLESANARILGTVLIDRIFPIPQNIYRRL